MIYHGMDIFNAAEIIPLDDGFTWRRVPKSVEDHLEVGQQAFNMSRGTTGVELRFVMRSDKVVFRMQKVMKNESTQNFHVFRGSIQGSWEDHESSKALVNDDVVDFEIKRSNNLETLREMAKLAGDPFDPEVVRVIFDRGHFKILDIIGEIEIPRSEQLPKKTMLSYGSSITHGSNSIDMSHSWVSEIAHDLKVDARNLGFAGACAMEPEMADYLADLGKKGFWDFATLELGINVLHWDREKMVTRSENLIRRVAGENPTKPVFVISPFYAGEDFHGGKRADLWREVLREVCAKLALPNVTLINGLDLLGDVTLLSADEVHPNIYGVRQIADRLGKILQNAIN